MHLTKLAGVGVALLALALAAAPPVALAADNMTVLDGAAASKTLRCKDVGAGVLSCTTVLLDSSFAVIDPATSGNQTAQQATAGSDASKAVAVQGVTGGKAVPVSVLDSLGGNLFDTAWGALQIATEPHQIFYDPFDAALDTANRWTSTSAGGGVAASTTAGNMTLGTGTTANGYAKLTSQPSITPVVPGRLGNSWFLGIPAAPITNAYAFWGMGLTPATPTAAAPVNDGYGFEVTTAGKLVAVVYGGGVRTQIADLSASGTNKQPTDGLLHRYIVYYRTDKIYWYIDGVSSAQLVASTPASYTQPTVQSLPVLTMAIAGSTAPASSQVTNVAGLAVWDTAQNSVKLTDATFAWRGATIKDASTAAAASDPALVVAKSPNDAPTTLAAGENHTGEVGSNLTAITVAQTVTAASAYASGNAVGGLMTLTGAVRVSGAIGASGTSGMLQDVTVNSKSAQNTQIDVFVFNANPTGSTCTDKTAFVLAAADFNKLVAVAHITDWTAGNVASFGQASGYAKTFAIASGTTAYACAVTRSTPTYTATTDLSFNFGIVRN